jgi:hypothetical protein
MKKAAGSQTNGKIIPIRSSPGVFGPGLREKLEESVKPYTDKPTEAVSSLENAFCVFLVSGAAALASKLGELAGRKVAEAVLPKGSL